jgi:hypothetical protein
LRPAPLLIEHHATLASGIAGTLRRDYNSDLGAHARLGIGRHDSSDRPLIIVLAFQIERRRRPWTRRGGSGLRSGRLLPLIAPTNVAARGPPTWHPIRARLTLTSREIPAPLPAHTRPRVWTHPAVVLNAG